MRRGYFKSPYGLMKRTRADWRSVTRKNNSYYDVMGTKSKTRKGAATQNSFISNLGL